MLSWCAGEQASGQLFEERRPDAVRRSPVLTVSMRPRVRSLSRSPRRRALMSDSAKAIRRKVAASPALRAFCEIARRSTTFAFMQPSLDWSDVRARIRRQRICGERAVQRDVRITGARSGLAHQNGDAAQATQALTNGMRERLATMPRARAALTSLSATAEFDGRSNIPSAASRSSARRRPSG